MPRPAGVVASWEVPDLTKDDFSVTYRLETYAADGDPQVQEVVMRPTKTPDASSVTASVRRNDGYFQLCTLVVEPSQKENPPPLPNTRKHVAQFTVRYGEQVLHVYTLEWHAYDWTRIKKTLDVMGDDGEPKVDLNRLARLMVINKNYRYQHQDHTGAPLATDAEMILRYNHTPRLVINGERGPSDWQPGQEAARDGHSVFTNQPREYYVRSLYIYIDAVHLHNTRKAEAHRKRMATVIDIDPINRLRQQIPLIASSPPVTQKAHKRKRKHKP